MSRLAAPLSVLLTACAPAASGGPDEGGFGYVPLLTGQVAEVSPDTLERTRLLGDGHSIVHGVAVTSTSVWIGNRDVGRIDRPGLPGLSGQPSIAIDHAINRVVSGPYVAVSGDAVASPYGASISFLDPASGALVSRIDIPLDARLLGPTSMPVEGASVPVQECPTCPRTGVVVEGPTKAWAIHTRNHALYELNPEAGTVSRRIDVAKPEGVDSPALSPFLALSSRGRLATADLYARRVSLWNPSGELSTGDRLAVEVEWSPDGGTLYVLTAESEVIIGDEAHNAAIPTEILAVDGETLEILARGVYDQAINHIAASPRGDSVFATSGRGVLLRFDALTLVRTGTAQIAAGTPPALDIYF